MTEDEIMSSNPLAATITLYDQTEVIPLDNDSINDLCILFKSKGDALWAFGLDYEQAKQLASQLTEAIRKTEEVSAENVPQTLQDLGTVFQNLTPDEQDEFFNQWVQT